MKLEIGKQYNLKLNDKIFNMYYIGLMEYDSIYCDCCDRTNKKYHFFSEEYYPNDVNKTWDSGTIRIGTSCIKRVIK